VSGGSAAWAAVPAAIASPVARHGPLAEGSSKDPVHSRLATSSKLLLVARAIASCPRKRSRSSAISVSSDSITSSAPPAPRRGLPRRARSSISAASNRLARPSEPRRGASTPRLTYEYRLAGLMPSRCAASAAPIHSVTLPLPLLAVAPHGHLWTSILTLVNVD